MKYYSQYRIHDLFELQEPLGIEQLGLHVKTGVYEKICGKFSPVCQKMTNFAL